MGRTKPYPRRRRHTQSRAPSSPSGRCSTIAPARPPATATSPSWGRSSSTSAVAIRRGQPSGRSSSASQFGGPATAISSTPWPPPAAAKTNPTPRYCTCSKNTTNTPGQVRSGTAACCSPSISAAARINTVPTPPFSPCTATSTSASGATSTISSCSRSMGAR